MASINRVVLVGNLTRDPERDDKDGDVIGEPTKRASNAIEHPKQVSKAAKK